MKILVNCSNLKTAGGLAVALNFIKWVSKNSNEEYLFIAPDTKDYRAIQRSTNVELIFLNDFWTSSIVGRFILDEVGFLFLRFITRSDIIFTMGNFAVRSFKPQALLYMWPYPNYPEFTEIWSRMDRRTRLKQKLRLIEFRRKLSRAAVVFPQTSTSEKRLKKIYASIVKSTRVIPMGVSTISNSINLEKSWHERGEIKLICLTRYYSHKNIEILIELGEIIVDRGLKIYIDITVDANQNSGSLLLDNLINNSRAKNVVRLIGNVAIEEVINLYEQYDGMILPTLLESYSATYADCLAYGMPLLTSDLDFAHDACGESAHFFDPFSAHSILDTILFAMESPGEITRKVELGRLKSSKSPKWSEIGKRYENELLKLL